MDLEHFPTSPAAKRMLASVSEEFYAKAYVAKWLYQVMGLEWDAVWEIIDAMPEQSFVETATWGLMYHEIKWGLPVRENLDYATRRRLIYEKRDVRKPMNPWAMERIILDMTGRASKVTDSHDDPNIPTNTFVVEIESAETDLDIGAVLNKIRSVKQSHVSFTVFICARVNIRISTPTYPYRFPYRMTGEHPDIHVWGGVESASVNVGTAASGHPFSYPVTDPHLAGTVPHESTLGFIRGVPLDMRAEGSGAQFPYTPAGAGLAGTLPDTNIPAYIKDVGIEADASGEGLVFPYIQTGTKPDVNTAGYVRRSELRNTADAKGTVFQYHQAGTKPDMNTEGAIQTAEVIGTASGNGAVFSYGSAGEADAGTLPDVNLRFAQDAVGIRNATTGAGAAFSYPPAGEGEAGTRPEDVLSGGWQAGTVRNAAAGEGTVFPYGLAGMVPGVSTAGTGQAAEVSGMASGSGTVISYPLCGDSDD